ncbi:MAG: aspartate carbamoyltransferase catalytic subunit [Elusimicrobia bacterium]|nr:aspartate carbamoyltransferase catalytic subunit [Elusimicrobiota bacterium]
MRKKMAVQQKGAGNRKPKNFIWTRKDLLGIRELTPEEILCILDLAATHKRRWFLKDRAGVAHFSEKAAALLFYEPSTRTRLSFALAAQRLGAKVIQLAQGESSMQKGESLEDTVRILDALGVDWIILRTSDRGVLAPLAPQVRASLVNGGDGIGEHPTQALLDLMTIAEQGKPWGKLRVTLIGDILHSRVARSLVAGLKSLGVQVTLCGPRAFLTPEVVEELRVPAVSDIQQGLREADVIYVLRVQRERHSGTRYPSASQYAREYGLTEARIQRWARPGAVILHPGPVHRGVELDSPVVEGPHSAIWRQVENGLYVRMAVLSLLAGVPRTLRRASGTSRAPRGRQRAGKKLYNRRESRPT